MNTLSEKLKLYAVTDSRLLKNGITLREAVVQAVKGGASIIQLREKNKNADEIAAVARELLPVCHEYGVPLIVNDSVKAAVDSGADGVHLGLDDGDISAARYVLGENAIIGATAHNLREAQAAAEAGADYLGCGAVFATSTKDNTVPLSIDELSRICRSVDIPVVAIGGINTENAICLKGTGIAGIAVVSAVFAQKDITAAASALKNISDKL